MPSGTILPVKVVDLDTTGSTDNANGVAVLLPSASGAVIGGTSANPLRTDTTGTTTQPISAAALPLPSGAATETTVGTRLSESDFDTKIGSLTETTPASDTASSGLNGRLQRIAQRLTSMIGLLPTALSNGFFQVSIKETITLPSSQSGTWTVQPGNTANTTAWKVDGSAVTQPVSIADDSDSATGAKADSVASTDTGTFSLIALFKLSLTKLTTISTNIATLAGIVASSVASVAIAEKTLTSVTGTISSSGDNTIIAAQGSGVRIKIVSLRIQNESSTASTAILKDGTTAIGRVLGQNQGDGISEVYPAGRPIVLSANTLFAINLSGANSHGYTVRYYAE